MGDLERAKECPDVHEHTKCPSEYVKWSEWAEKKGKTHKQFRCPSCDLYVIWRRRAMSERLTPEERLRACREHFALDHSAEACHRYVLYADALQAIRDAETQERNRIVEWLREGAGDPMDAENWDPCAVQLAELIEAGDHRKEE